MLTPCLISTLHSLPNRVRFSRHRTYDESGKSVYALDFLTESIDLLVMDEAGQVGPHIGMAAFALARRALVVGDVHQLEPAMKIPAGTDRANALQCGLMRKWSEDGPVSPHILSESLEGLLGSVMRVAQQATAYSGVCADQEPGIFLSEHRRCDEAIIRFCNDLIYGGRLQPRTPTRPKAPEMGAWGWAHVRGSCVRRGSSLVNESEAQAIVEWIAKRSDGEHGWLEFYKRLHPKYDDLSKVVAVLTPFAAQAGEIRKRLRERERRLARVNVGTVNTLQGAECPIVVFSPTYSADQRRRGRMFFDRKPNMLNVAVSRAEDSFIVIGDMRVMCGGDRLNPSSRLAEFFYTPSNEITDVDGNYGFKPEVLTKAKRLSTLDEHRRILAQAFQRVRSEEVLIVVSPFITKYAVDVDDIAALCHSAVSRGAQVHIVIEIRSADDVERRAPEAIAVLRGAGATVQILKGIHNKTLVVGNRAIVEGSFNWLSAMRDRANQHFNLEASYLVSGASAEADIARAIAELNERGAEIR